MIECPSAHKRERCHLDDVSLDMLIYSLKSQHFVECVVQRSQIGINFLGKIPGQKAQALACLHCRAHQQNPFNLLVKQCVYCTGYRQISFTRACRTDPEVDVVMSDGADVVFLVTAARCHREPFGANHTQALIHTLIFPGPHQIFEVRFLQAKVNSLGAQLQTIFYFSVQCVEQ